MTPLSKVRHAATAHKRAGTQRDLLIREAHAAGCSLRQIGEAAGLSHVRVLQIIRGE